MPSVSILSLVDMVGVSSLIEILHLSLVPGYQPNSNIIYASEADLLNVALFGKTARQWRDESPQAKGNIRDEATLEQLIVLSNLESVNAVLIREGLTQSERLTRLNQIAITQLTSLLNNEHIKRLNEGN